MKATPMSQPPVADRSTPLVPSRTALLLIDVQKGVYGPAVATTRRWFHRSATETAIPNMVRLLAAARSSGSEVVFTVIRSLTRDGRDRSLDYKQTGFHFAPGSVEADVCDEVRPDADEIVLPKTSSSLFNSTVFAYAMRNIGVDTIVVGGFLTDQCVDHAIRDGADLGFGMICAIDACTTESRARHDNALAAFAGYCRAARTSELVDEFTTTSPPNALRR